MLRPATVAIMAFLAALVSAASPVGVWTGRLQMKAPPIPANLPPTQKRAFAQAFAQIKAAKLVLDLKADKTYTGKTVGLPGPPPPVEKGTWSQAGRIVKLVPKSGGKGTQTLTMSPDGKTMVLPLPEGRGRAVFSR